MYKNIIFWDIIKLEKFVEIYISFLKGEFNKYIKYIN